ncbi:MAG TPA: cysteine desulfurase [Erysipelotrichaceae bacterium]|nr:cysteine desulfurase [Erysipelotrichaceae bacterium]
MPRVQRRIYLDSASTTNIDPEVLSAYKQLLDRYYVNSESLYDEGAEISRMLEKARSACAGLLGVKSNEIIFTAGSSESNSAAVKGVCFAQPGKKHIVTTQIEHSSILNACRQMERVFGYDVTYLPVTEKGSIRIDDLKHALRDDTALVSIMLVNNETGAVNPVRETAEYVKKHSHAFFHCDITQAVGKMPVSLENIDLASLSAHKLEGLKGSGILVKKTHVPFEPLINGGEQEGGLRGGTSNAQVNMMFARTLRLALERESKNREHIQKLHDILIEGLRSIDGMEINSPEDGLPCTVSFSYEKIPSEVMQNALNRAGFMVSARSTCEAHSNNPSYVLQAMGFSDARASSCIRVSMSRHNTEQEIRELIHTLKEITDKYGEL